MAFSLPTWIRFLVVGCGAGLGLINATAPPVTRPESRGFPGIRSYLPRAYDSHNQVWTAKQGPDGVMYFGTNSEIVTFDGLIWRKIEVPGGAYMRAMDIDPQGTVWVGGVGELGRLGRNDQGRWGFTSLKPHLPPTIQDVGDLRRIHAMPDGVYFQTDAYLLRWRDEAQQFDVWEMHEPYVTLAVRMADRLILSREAGWMMPTTVNAWEPVPGEPDPSHFMLLSQVASDGRGGWWASAGRHGLQHYDGQSTTTVTGETAEFLNAGRLFGIARLPDGRLLFPMLGQGLLITTPDLTPLVHLTAENGLPSNTVICVTPISDSVVWVGTEQGIARLDLSPGLSRFSPLNGLERNGANAVIRTERGPMFATTHGPLILETGSSHTANPQFSPAIDIDDKLNTFHPLADGGMLLGGLRSMWWVDADQQVHQLHSPSNISEILVHPRFPDHVFALHLTGIAIWRRDGATWSEHRPIAGVQGEFQSLETDDAGNVWFGSSNAGVGRLPYGDFAPGTALWDLPDPEAIRYDERHGLPPLRNRIRVRRIDGEPLFMTSFGLFRFDATTERFKPEARYGAAFADGTWATQRAVASPSGGVWIEARSALPAPEDSFRQIGKSVDGQWLPLHVPNLEFVGRLDALECEIVDGDEILWLCGGEGVIRINVTQAQSSLSESPAAGPTVLHHVTSAAGQILPFDFTSEAPLEIAAKHNSLRFHFGTPGLAGEIAAAHRSRLIGFVDGNLESNNTGERTFTNLPPGHYTFEVSGRTSDHHWSTSARAPFIVLAPWWRTTVAKLAYGMLFAAGLYTIVRWRTRRLERQRTALEELVTARTAELAHKAAALERLHELDRDEALAARLAAETARLELLRYQLNPHFLFNSLNSIRALVYSAPDAAGEMVSKLAEFCRRTLSRGGDEMVTVADELEMARHYLDIEQVRWQSGLAIELTIDETSRACKLPQNLLLPILENAIKYGGRTSPDLLRVNIETRLDAGILTCAVTNSGRWIKPDTNPFTDSTQIGLQNLRQRLHRHYGDTARLDHDDSIPGWVTVRFTLPCQPPV